MNWARFQTYGMAPDKAFEVLCNQLFENWCKDEYGSNVASFSVVNGAGGDGGVESYAVLTNGDVIGLQAKWFPNSMSSNQISQVKGSIETAIKVRPAIKRYIVCVPRDLASKTAKPGTNEAERWNTLIENAKNDYPNVTVDLWNETRITTELEKPACAGVYRFWFENAEICDQSIGYAFEKAKASWLKTKYVPELNTYGKIEGVLSTMLGEEKQRTSLKQSFAKISELCEQYRVSAEAFKLFCTKDDELIKAIDKAADQFKDIGKISRQIESWCTDEGKYAGNISYESFSFDFDSLIEQIQRSHASFRHHFHASEVTKVLRKLSRYDFYELLKQFDSSRRKESVLFLGNPGTGKTHGLAAVADKIINDGIHIPLIIQARGISPACSWKDIIASYLGLSATWGEDEIWQALTSLANRHRLASISENSSVKILPKVILMVDGLDESAPYDRWVERMRETNAIIKRYPRIRFCFTSRPTAMPRPYDYAKSVHIRGSGDVATHDLFDKYMSVYRIVAQNRGWLRSALTTPLALKLFCELNQGKTVDIKDRAEVSITSLWRQKVAIIEKEYCEKCNDSPQNQNIFRAIVYLSEIFIHSGTIEHTVMIRELKNGLSVSDEKAERLLQYLENYGVLSSRCEWGTGILPDRYNYFPGIQGYFDYAAAAILIERYGHPQNIDFRECQGIDSNTLNGLAILAIQKYDYLLTRNVTLDAVSHKMFDSDLQFLALQHTNYINALQFVERSKEIMASCADGLITIVNKIVLPLSQDINHPLGVSLLHEFLNGFDKPAQRDILWSLTTWLRDDMGKRWYHSEAIALKEDNYLLTADDLCDGLPTVYAWALSSISNPLRKLYRDRLMVWAQKVPEEFFKLFQKFATVNDPQIRSDIFSILMCLVHDVNDRELLLSASRWVMAHVLHPERIDKNRDISIRYYSIAILRKAIFEAVITEEDAKDFLPPYHAKNYEIPLCSEALAGTRMGGYKAIDYDLARYVLIDHFHADFTSYTGITDGQFKELIAKVVQNQPEYAGITEDQLILSAAYAYLLNTGWNEDEFYNFSPNENGDGIVGGIDLSIGRTHHASTHGSMSPVMTVAEKYVWQARNEISGFLCDRLLFGDDAEEITDYGLLDDFIIPAHELTQVDPDDIPEDRPWHIPDPTSVILEGRNESREDVVKNVLDAPEIPWEQWICVDNPEGKYKIPSRELLALHMYSCFYGSAGVETNIFLNAVIVKSSDVNVFVEALTEKAKENSQISNPTDWYGGINASCYITPKEICCFPWKTAYQCSNIKDFPQVDLASAVDSCCHNTPEYGDVYYYLPSGIIRQKLKITDTDGYLYKDADNCVVAEHTIAGEKWRTYQTCLLVDATDLIEQLSQSQQQLVWIMRERRNESGFASEKYGRFCADRCRSYVGYFREGTFILKELSSEIQSNLPTNGSLDD